MQYRCPHCNRELARELFKRKVLFRCPDCGGEYMTVSALRGLCRSREFVNRLWRSALRSQVRGTICPECGRPMRQTQLSPHENSALLLDVCLTCQAVWFDPAELAALDVNELPEDKLSPEVRQAFAAYAEHYVRETANAFPRQSVNEAFKVIPELLGLPVEEDNDTFENLPFITWGIAVICIVVFLLSLPNLQTVIGNFGFIPDKMFRHYGATWISSMFLHSGWLHLLGNMYFLLVFGDNVEDEFGRKKYLLLILLSGFCASLAHALLDSRSQIPCVGASGFISAILGCYAVCFPLRQIRICCYKFIVALSSITLPAWTIFFPWLLFQIFLSIFNTAGSTAYFAHTGGAATGIAAALFYRIRCRKSTEIPSLYQKLTGHKSNSFRD